MKNSSTLPLILRISGEIFEWRGPAPFHFVKIEQKHSEKIKGIASAITYGWGVIPASAKIKKTSWDTALFPKNGFYLVPLKDVVRKAENLEIGDTVTINLSIGKK